MQWCGAMVDPHEVIYFKLFIILTLQRLHSSHNMKMQSDYYKQGKFDSKIILNWWYFNM